MNVKARTGSRGPAVIGWCVALVTALSVGSSLFVVALYGRLGIVQAGYAGTILLGVVAGIVIWRQPSNPMGHFLAVVALAVAASVLPFAYGIPAYLSHRGSWPGGQSALWLDAWLWVVPFGVATPLTLIRLPDGRVQGSSGIVTALSTAGTLLLVSWAALNPGPMFPFGLAPNPFGIAGAAGLLSGLAAAGLLLISIASGLGLASIVTRYQHAGSDEQQQIKWLALAGVVTGLSVIYAIGAVLLFRQSLLQALLPFSVAIVSGPVALAFAILRYRLYDIDLILNRALVYGLLTAILAGMYAAGVTLLQRLYIAVTGQKSDAALVLTAFAIAALFSPIRDRLQKLVDQRVRRGDPSQALDALSAEVESVVRVMDADAAARRLVDVAVESYQALYGAIYFDHAGRQDPFYARGTTDQPVALDLAISSDTSVIGRFVLGPRRGTLAYDERDRSAIQRSVDAIAQALTLALELRPVEARRISESHAVTRA